MFSRSIVKKVCEPTSIEISDPIDLCLAFYVLHEVPDAGSLFSQIRGVSKTDGQIASFGAQRACIRGEIPRYSGLGLVRGL